MAPPRNAAGGGRGSANRPGASGHSNSNSNHSTFNGAAPAGGGSHSRGRGTGQGIRGRGRGRHIPGGRGGHNAGAGQNPDHGSSNNGLSSRAPSSSTGSSAAGSMNTGDLRDLFKRLLNKLTNGQPRRPEDLARFLDTAWQVLQLDGEEDRVLQALADRGSSSSSSSGGGSGGGGGGGGLLLLQQLAQSTTAGADCRLQASAGNMQQASNALPFLQCFVPLLRLLGDRQLKTSTLQQYTNPIYATMYNCVDHARVAAVLKAISDKSPPDPFGSTGSTAGSSSLAGLRAPWQPTCWLDVLEPLVGYMLELPRRFRQQDTWEQHKAGIQSLYTVTEAVFSAKVQAQPGSQDEARAKRLKDSIRMLAQPLGHLQQQAQRLTEQQRRTQIRAQMAAGSSASIMLRSDPPGRLHPDGPRHDNDLLDFRCISITPTQQQVLCTKAPFLPRNR